LTVTVDARKGRFASVLAVDVMWTENSARVNTAVWYMSGVLRGAPERAGVGGVMSRQDVIRAVVFDFDGLMVDTETPAWQSWQEVYGEYEVDFPLDRWCATLGGSGREFDPAAYLEDRLGTPLETEAIRARRRKRKWELTAEQPLMPGVAAYLDDAQRLGLHVGVASSSPRAWVVGHLERLGIASRFDVIATANDVERVKPAPDLYLAAIETLGAAPEHAIALEDAPNGLLAAKRAGLWAVAVPNSLTGRLPLDHADVRVVSLADVPLEQLIVMVALLGPEAAAEEQHLQRDFDQTERARTTERLANRRRDAPGHPGGVAIPLQGPLARTAPSARTGHKS
jgi:HAD superfamily hydrolase (TIGR01509 family)